MANDARQVVRQLRQRWQQQYGETLDVEDIRRHLNRLLQELQEREIKAVFSTWSGAELNDAIDALFDFDEKEAKSVATLSLSEPVGAPPVAPTPPDDSEYLPSACEDSVEQVMSGIPAQRIVVRRGRPAGSKNKPK